MRRGTHLRSALALGGCLVAAGCPSGSSSAGAATVATPAPASAQRPIGAEPPPASLQDVMSRGASPAERALLASWVQTAPDATLRLAALRRLEELGAPDATVVATGGLAELIAPHSSVIEHVDPFLTLEGLRLVWELNRDS